MYRKLFLRTKKNIRRLGRVAKKIKSGYWVRPFLTEYRNRCYRTIMSLRFSVASYLKNNILWKLKGLMAYE